ncbi:MAG: V-type ATP synthase subunit F [Thermoplasmata archaeon HGW-Thermoplasmata-2]|nr:MAG: V-type ATP synthase subunit F [Thermoplasmata archaeon HGW-Thermoplasmata-2]
MTDHQIAVIGDDESVSGFSAIGIHTYPVKDSDEALGVLQTIRKKNYGIIFITESYARGLEVLLTEIGTEALPIIISIPGKEGSTGVGVRWLRKVAERAVGFDILSRKD